MKVLVTGGAGYIGSHTCLQLLQSGYDVVVVDNLSNASRKSLDRVEELAGRSLTFYEGDVRDSQVLDEIFDAHDIGGVIHFAALKAVGESTKKPLEYYQNNVQGTVNLLDVMRKHGCKSFVFSSSATVYGTPAYNPITEDFPTGGCTNPYGRTKYMIEEILKDLHGADPDWNIVIFRYFNPIGAHASGRIGENPNGIPNNLMPYITQVVSGKLEVLGVFGDDYPTPDGTGVRDYIHVVDLADAHVKAIDLFDGKIGGCGDAGVACEGVAGNVGNDVAPAGGNFCNGGENAVGLRVYNLGTGRGTSVLELVNIFGEATGEKVPYVIKERRPGDIAENYCNASKAAAELGWEAQFDVFDMCRDSWNWQKNNPNGYEPV